MSKSPREISASFEVTDEGDEVLIEIKSVGGFELSPQMILDAVADMLTAKYGMLPEEWEYPKEGLDS